MLCWEKIQQQFLQDLIACKLERLNFIFVFADQVVCLQRIIVRDLFLHSVYSTIDMGGCE